MSRSVLRGSAWIDSHFLVRTSTYNRAHRLILWCCSSTADHKYPVWEREQLLVIRVYDGVHVRHRP